MLRTTRARYFGSVIAGCLNQVRIVFRDKPICQAISRTDRPSRKCSRLIFANILTVITPFSPAQKVRREGRSRRSVFGENYPAVSLRGVSVCQRLGADPGKPAPLPGLGPATIVSVHVDHRPTGKLPVVALVPTTTAGGPMGI